MLNEKVEITLSTVPVDMDPAKPFLPEAGEHGGAEKVNAGSGDIVEDLARALLTERLAACVNIFPQGRSIYWWEGKLECEAEHLLIIKSRPSLRDKLYRRINQLHPYENPEIITLKTEDASEAYKFWVNSETIIKPEDDDKKECA